MKEIYLFLVISLIALTKTTAQTSSITTIDNITKITNYAIPMYHKFEVGFNLVNSRYNNPYNPDEIDAKTIFYSPSGKEYIIDGFYYIPFQRIDDPNIVNQGTWQASRTLTPWRCRFAPNEVGEWTYKIAIIEDRKNNTDTIYSGLSTFFCTVSNNNGYLELAPNNRYFQFSDGTSFFGIAQDARASYFNTIDRGLGDNPPPMQDPKYLIPPNGLPNNISGYKSADDYYYYQHYLWYEKIINDFAENGGNYIRVWMEPLSFEIEWEHLNNYDGRQKRAHDLDLIFEHAALKKVFIHLVLYNEKHLDFADCQSEIMCWDDNPYYLELNLGGPLDLINFFSNDTAKENFKYRLRYIQARWGYSTALGSYSIINEPEFIGRNSYGTTTVNWADGSIFSFQDPDRLSENYYNNSPLINQWINEMANYLHTKHPQHLTSVDYGYDFSGDANYDSSIDFTNTHLYTSDEIAQHQRNYVMQHHIDIYDKPSGITEYSPTECVPNDLSGFSTHVHNEIWASSFSGSFSTGFFYYGEYKYNCPTYCQGPIMYAPLASFLDGEDYNSNLDFYYKPIGNVKQLFNNENQKFNAATGGILDGSTPPLLESNSPNKYGFAGTYLGTTLDQKYLVDGVTTSDDKISVFALQKSDRIIGWVHNREHYAYNVRNQAVQTVGCEDYNNPDISSNSNYPLDNDLMPILYSNMTINNLTCDGIYQIDWYNTYGNGGISNIYSSSTLNSASGQLTIPLPNLEKGVILNSNQDVLEAPDYGFKISLLTPTSVWNHENHNKITCGEITVGDNELFYYDCSGKVSRLYWSHGKWEHEQISGSTNYEEVKQGTKIIIGNYNQIFYINKDGWVAQYYYDNGWNHAFLTSNWNNGERVLDGTNLSITSDNQIFYTNIDNWIAQYYYNNGWNHTFLTSNWDSNEKILASTEIVIGSNNQIFYINKDRWIAQYYYDNGWNHAFLTSNWKNSERALDATNLSITSDNQIFYTNIGNWIAQYYYDNGWNHAFLTSNWDNNEKILASTEIIIGDNNQIFYINKDRWIAQYYYDNGWNHAFLTSNWNNDERVLDGTNLSITSNNQIFYTNMDNWISHYYFNSGWNHDFLTSTWNNNEKSSSRLEVGNNDKVFFVNKNSSQIQHYWWGSICNNISDYNLRPLDKKHTHYLEEKQHYIKSTTATQQKHTNTNIKSIKVYPNPATDLINIDFQSTFREIEVNITDVTGRNVLSIKKYNKSHINLDIAHLPKGLYIAHIKYDNQVSKLSKFVKK